MRHFLDYELEYPNDGAAVVEKQAPIKVAPKIGMNDPCPYGSD